MKKLILFLAILMSNYVVFAQEKEIRNLLEQQRLDWNKGNLEAYMQGYWKSDSLLFVGKNGAKYGKDEHFVVKSKKYNRSAAFHYRPDNKATNDKRSHFIHTSTFPEGEHYVRSSSKGIKVESASDIEYTIFEVE